jgi:thiamine-phosphate pyrophosphorylase
MIVQLITDRHRLADRAGRGDFRDARACLIVQARYAADAGVDYIHVRERDLEARDLADLVAALVARTRGTGTRVVVNDRLDIALACGADGVHLRADSMAVAAVRRVVPPDFVVGRSIHGASEIADTAGADYLVAGAVWETRSKPTGHACLGLEGFAALARATRVPVLAIGGVTVPRAGDVGAAGGAGIAAIGLFIDETGEAEMLEERAADEEKTLEPCRAVPLASVVAALRAQFDTPRSGS